MSSDAPGPLDRIESSAPSASRRSARTQALGATSAEIPHPTLSQRIAWGGFVSAALLLTGLVSYTVWKAQFAEEFLDEEELVEQLAELPEEPPVMSERIEPALAEEPAPEPELKAQERSGVVQISDEVSSPRVPVVEDLSVIETWPATKNNRQAVHFAPADDPASRRAIEQAGFTLNPIVAKPAAWLAGTIEEAVDSPFSSNSHDVSGPRHR